MNRPLKGLAAALEGVLYRGKSPFYLELVGIYADVLAGEQQGWAVRVSNAIGRHANLDITVVVDDTDALFAELAWKQFDVNHIFRSAQYNDADFQGTTFNLAPMRKLMGDSKAILYDTGKVHGAFAHIPAQLWMSRGMLGGTFTAEELAAITLHETGHMYTYFDVMGRTIATSVAVSQAEELLARTTNPADRRHAVAEVAKLLQFEDIPIDLDALAQPGEEKTFEYVMIRNTVAAQVGEGASAKLFNGEAEYLADSYAIRLGAAQPLVSANIKLAKAYSDPHTRGRVAHIYTQALKAAFFAVAAINPVSGVIAGLIGALMLAGAKDDANARNTPIERLEAVHGDLVAISKDRRLPRELITQLVVDFNFVSALREQLKDNMTLGSVLWSTLVPAKRHEYKQIQLQREIGKLVNNDLFMKAAALTAMSR